MTGAFGGETFQEDSEQRLDPWRSTNVDVLLGAIGEMYEDVQEIVRDGDQPGWTVPLTISLAKNLDWLGQFLGVRREPQLTEAQFRAAIIAVAGFARGTPAAISSAAGRTLTGNKNVGFYERFGGDAYELTVITYTSQTPSPAATEAAIRAVKPAGIKLTYLCVSGRTYIEVKETYATYTALEAAFATYTALRDAA